MITCVSQCGLYRDLFELRDIPDKGQCSSDSSAGSVQTLFLMNNPVRTLNTAPQNYDTILRPETLRSSQSSGPGSDRIRPAAGCGARPPLRSGRRRGPGSASRPAPPSPRRIGAGDGGGGGGVDRPAGPEPDPGQSRAGSGPEPEPKRGKTGVSPSGPARDGPGQMIMARILHGPDPGPSLIGSSLSLSLSGP